MKDYNLLVMDRAHSPWTLLQEPIPYLTEQDALQGGLKILLSSGLPNIVGRNLYYNELEFLGVDNTKQGVLLYPQGMNSICIVIPKMVLVDDNHRPIDFELGPFDVQ